MIDGRITDLLRQIAAGDRAAADELVRRYEPELRRAVRVRLTDSRLRRVIDSVDVCQSVFANFFIRAAVGEFDVNQSGELAALLVTMARNRLIDQVRRLHSHKRDQRRDGGTLSAIQQVAEPAPGPDEEAARRDLVAEVRRRMSRDEQELADLRGEGYDWAEIAARLGGNPEALRKKLSRALDRVTAELGLEELQP